MEISSCSSPSYSLRLYRIDYRLPLASHSQGLVTGRITRDQDHITTELEINAAGLMAFSYDTMPVFDSPCPVITATPNLYASPRIMPSSTFISLVLVGRLGGLRIGVSGIVLELVACRTCQYLFCKNAHSLRPLPGLTVHHESRKRVDAVHNNETCKPSTFVHFHVCPSNMLLSIRWTRIMRTGSVEWGHWPS